MTTTTLTTSHRGSNEEPPPVSRDSTTGTSMVVSEQQPQCRVLAVTAATTKAREVSWDESAAAGDEQRQQQWVAALDWSPNDKSTTLALLNEGISPALVDAAGAAAASSLPNLSVVTAATAALQTTSSTTTTRPSNAVVTAIAGPAIPDVNRKINGKMVVDLDREEIARATGSSGGHPQYQEYLERFGRLFQEQPSDQQANILNFFINFFVFQRRRPRHRHRPRSDSADDVNDDAITNQEPLLTLDEASARDMLRQALSSTASIDSSNTRDAAVAVGVVATSAEATEAAVETAALIASMSSAVQNSPKQAQSRTVSTRAATPAIAPHNASPGPNELSPPPPTWPLPDNVTSGNAQNSAASPLADAAGESRRKSSRERRPSRRAALAAADNEYAARLEAEQPMEKERDTDASMIVYINQLKRNINAKYNDALQVAVKSYQSHASSKTQQDMIVESIAQQFEFRKVSESWSTWQLASTEAVRLHIHGALACLAKKCSTSATAPVPAVAAGPRHTVASSSSAPPKKKLRIRIKIPKKAGTLERGHVVPLNTATVTAATADVNACDASKQTPEQRVATKSRLSVDIPPPDFCKASKATPNFDARPSWWTDLDMFQRPVDHYFWGTKHDGLPANRAFDQAIRAARDEYERSNTKRQSWFADAIFRRFLFWHEPDSRGECKPVDTALVRRKIHRAFRRGSPKKVATAGKLRSAPQANGDSHGRLRDKDVTEATLPRFNIAGRANTERTFSRTDGTHGPDRPQKQGQGQGPIVAVDTGPELDIFHQIILPPFNPSISDDSWTDKTVEQLAVSFRSSTIPSDNQKMHGDACGDSDDESDDDLLAEDDAMPPSLELPPSDETPRTKSELNAGTAKTGKLVVYCSAGNGRQDGNKMLVARMNIEREAYAAVNTIEQERMVASILEDFNFQQPATITDLWVPACAARTTDLVKLALAGNNWEKLLTQWVTEQVKPLGSPLTKNYRPLQLDHTPRCVGTSSVGALTTSPQRVSKVVVLVGSSQENVEYKAAIWANCESYRKAIACGDAEQQNEIVDSLASRFDFQRLDVKLNEWFEADPDLVRRTITTALESRQQWKPISTTASGSSIDCEDDDPSMSAGRDLDTAVSAWLGRSARAKASCHPFLPPILGNATKNPSSVAISTNGPNPPPSPASAKRKDSPLRGRAVDAAFEVVRDVDDSRPVVYCGCCSSNDKQPGNIAYRKVLLATQHKYQQDGILQRVLEDAIAAQFQFVRQSSRESWEPAPKEVIRKKIQNALHYLGRNQGAYGVDMSCDDGTARIVAQVHAALDPTLLQTTQSQQHSSPSKKLSATTPLVSVQQTVAQSNGTNETPIVQCGQGFQDLPGNIAYFQYIASIHDQYTAAAGNETERELLVNMVRERFAFERNGQPEADRMVRKKIIKALRNERYGKRSSSHSHHLTSGSKGPTTTAIPVQKQRGAPTSERDGKPAMPPTIGSSVPLHLRKPPPPSQAIGTTVNTTEAAKHHPKARKVSFPVVAKQVRTAHALAAATPHNKQVVHCGQGFRDLAGNVAYLEYIASIQGDYTAAVGANSSNSREEIIASVLARFDFYRYGKRADETFCRYKVTGALGNKRYGNYTTKKRPAVDATKAMGQTRRSKKQKSRQGSLKERDGESPADSVAGLLEQPRPRGGAAMPVDHLAATNTGQLAQYTPGPAPSRRPQHVIEFLNEIIVIK